MVWSPSFLVVHDPALLLTFALLLYTHTRTSYLRSPSLCLLHQPLLPLPIHLHLALVRPQTIQSRHRNLTVNQQHFCNLSPNSHKFRYRHTGCCILLPRCHLNHKFLWTRSKDSFPSKRSRDWSDTSSEIKKSASPLSDNSSWYLQQRKCPEAIACQWSASVAFRKVEVLRLHTHLQASNFNDSSSTWLSSHHPSESLAPSITFHVQ